METFEVDNCDWDKGLKRPAAFKYLHKGEWQSER